MTEHVWIGVWLTDDLEGYICGNCLRECLEPNEVIFPCEKSKPPKKKESVEIETRYTGDLPFPSWKKWHKYHEYADLKFAEKALDTLNRNRKGNFEYRIKPNDTNIK